MWFDWESVFYSSIHYSHATVMVIKTAICITTVHNLYKYEYWFGHCIFDLGTVTGTRVPTLDKHWLDVLPASGRRYHIEPMLVRRCVYLLDLSQ